MAGSGGGYSGRSFSSSGVGSAGSYSGNEEGGGEKDCHSLVIETQVGSPQENVINRLRVGDLLDVAVQQTESGQTRVALLHNNDVVGGVASPLVQRLRDCIASGVSYVAQVMAINGGQVRVIIRAVSSS